MAAARRRDRSASPAKRSKEPAGDKREREYKDEARVNVMLKELRKYQKVLEKAQEKRTPLKTVHGKLLEHQKSLGYYLDEVGDRVFYVARDSDDDGTAEVVYWWMAKSTDAVELWIADDECDMELKWEWGIATESTFREMVRDNKFRTLLDMKHYKRTEVRFIKGSELQTDIATLTATAEEDEPFDEDGLYGFFTK